MTVRVTKVKAADGNGVSYIAYDVWLPDGGSMTFTEDEPFGTLNEVEIFPAGNLPGACRFRNNPGANFSDAYRPDQAMQPIDDEDFAIVKAAVGQKLNVDALPWIIGADDKMEEKKEAGTIDVPGLKIVAR